MRTNEAVVKQAISIRHHYKINPSKLLSYIILFGIVIIVFLPLILVLFSSFKNVAQIANEFPLKPPSLVKPYLENYKTVFTQGKILIGFRNSLILVVASVALNAVIGTMTAYTIHRFNFKFKKVVLALFTLGMVVPSYVTEIARFPIIRNIGAYNTIAAPIIIYAATDLMQLYIYIQFISKIPTSLDESAMIDGCSYFGIFFRIIFPLLLPATATLGIIKAVEVMNDMYIPYLYMPSEKLRTATTTLMAFSSSQFGSWEILSAAIVVIMLPTIIIYLILQKYIFAGIVAGAVKE
jgi:raffinose/stachyose/melibiose transport system permease protein